MLVFLAAPIDDPRVVACLGARSGGGQARLSGYVARVDRSNLHVGLVADANGSLLGTVYEVDASEVARIEFIFAALGTPLVAVTVTIAGHRTEVMAPIASDPANFPDGPEPGVYSRRRIILVREVIREIAGHFGTRPVADMPVLLHGIGFRALARMRAQTNAPPADHLRSGFGVADLTRETLDYPYAKYFGVEEHLLRHRHFDGSESASVLRAVLASGDAVTVLPWDPARDSVLLIEQFRAGPVARRDPKPWTIEAIAGRCDGFEPPVDAARREAREEAGLELGRLEHISGYYPTPGTSAEFITSFVGEADLGDSGGLHGVAEEHEDIRAFVVDRAEAMAAVSRGEINNAPLILSLLWLALNRDRLIAAWRSA